MLRSVAHPGNISVRPNQHGSGSSDCAKYRKLPHTNIFSLDQSNPMLEQSEVAQIADVFVDQFG